MNSDAPQKETIPQNLRALGRQYGADCIVALTEEMLDPQLVEGLSVEWLLSHCMLPIWHKQKVKILMADPSDQEAANGLARKLGGKLEMVLAPAEVVQEAIGSCFAARHVHAQGYLSNLQQGEEGAERKTKEANLLEDQEQAPVVQLINLILLEAVKVGASDVHFEPFAGQFRVRGRIDGKLYDLAAPPKHMEAAMISRLKIMAQMDIAERRLPQDGAARICVGEQQVDIRVSSVPVAEGERIVMRLLHRNVTLHSLVELGMPVEVLEVWTKLLTQPNGIILVCGPTGSGKTTTLYTTINMLKRDELNVMTIEDPIEYQLPQIAQIQVQSQIGLTFAAGLRHILRQDPDVILVGEIRDLETAEIAVRASLTGHLVFSTLHANDTSSAIVRMIDMGVDASLLAASLRAVMAQRLIRCLCGKCKKSGVMDQQELARLGQLGARLNGQTVCFPVGCEDCFEGYRGRTGLFELMVTDVDMFDLIRDRHCNSRALRDLALRKGMRNLWDWALDKVAEGATSFQEVEWTLGALL